MTAPAATCPACWALYVPVDGDQCCRACRLRPCSACGLPWHLHSQLLAPGVVVPAPCLGLRSRYYPRDVDAGVRS